MKKIVIGVMPQKQIRARALAIVRGEYKPKPGEPKIWFTSMKSVAEVLSDSNRALLKVIRETEPESVAALAKKTGRQRSNLSRTLKTMSRYGLVDLKRENRHVRPVVKASDFQIQASARQAVVGGDRTKLGVEAARRFPSVSCMRCFGQTAVGSGLSRLRVFLAA